MILTLLFSILAFASEGPEYAEVCDNTVKRVILIKPELLNKAKEFTASAGCEWMESKPSNRAAKRYKYHPELNGFVPPKPDFRPSWKLNKEEMTWEAPVKYPSDGKDYKWDEENQEWKERK